MGMESDLIDKCSVVSVRAQLREPQFEDIDLGVSTTPHATLDEMLFTRAGMVCARRVRVRVRVRTRHAPHRI